MLHLNQVVDVRNADFRREARIDGAAAGAGAIQLRAGVIGVDDIFRLHAEAFEIRVEQRRVDVGVQHARNADAQLRARLHQLDALLGGFGPGARGNRIGDDFEFCGRNTSCAAMSTKFGIRVLDLVEPGLDALHVVHIFHRAFFAGGDDQALLVGRQRNLGDFLLGRRDGQGHAACRF